MKKLTISSNVNGTHDVLVDDDDFQLVSQYNWCIYRCVVKGKRSRSMYAVAHIGRRTIRMHRFILGISDPGVFIDHRDHNGLNNQRDNLRIATPQQNQFNMRKTSRNKAGFKGVSFHKRDRKYMVFLCVNRKNTYFGSFDDPIAAAQRYNQVAKHYFGEFAFQNRL